MKLSKTLLCAGVCAGLLGAYSPAQAVDFKVTGLWQFGFGVAQRTMVESENGHKPAVAPTNDAFNARQRVRLWLTAVASENLSGTVGVQIGHQRWGQKSSGAAFGTGDQGIIAVRQAYLDWMIPDTDVKVRMGLQEVSLPNTGLFQPVMHAVNVAGIVANWQANENIGVTAMWLRPFNDNFNGYVNRENGFRVDKNAYDNMDLFALTLPMKYDNVELTPWVMYGIQGKNTFRVGDKYYDGDHNWHSGENNALGGLFAKPFGNPNTQLGGTNKLYGSMVWFGLPVKVNMDPLTFSIQFDYGWVEAMGRYDYAKSHYNPVTEMNDLYHEGRASTERQGWAINAMAEYKMDWGIPGIFGWYASGDDSDLKNGSERLPWLISSNQASNILGDNVNVYGGMGSNDRDLPIGGTWGIGLQARNLSFLENVSHTVRAVLMGGTNDPSNVAYANYLTRGTNISPATAWQGPDGSLNYYLTTQDYLLEFDLQNTYNIYENLTFGLNGGYVVNMIDQDLWKKANHDTYSKQDMWMVDAVFRYRF